MSGIDVSQNLLQDVRLYENNRERERVDCLSELYAVLKSLECLETLFAGDYIAHEEYSTECAKLLRQYKARMFITALRQAQVSNVDDFVAKYQLTCPASLERIREGHPVIVRKKENTPKLIKDVVETFITYIDQLKLNVRAVDELQPSLNDLYLSVSAFPSLPDDAESRTKVKKWYVYEALHPALLFNNTAEGEFLAYCRLDKLNEMSATEEINEEEARQMTFDIECAYTAFNRFLENH
uniref:Vacuolar protein sorting-associated protein 28 homolog n=1 Tax=Syphacia muris TaxID=451379 RepID=A0A0N5AUK8_9BILA